MRAALSLLTKRTSGQIPAHVPYPAKYHARAPRAFSSYRRKQQQQRKMLPLITLEEHYMSGVEGAGFGEKLPVPPALLSKLTDLGPSRIKDLDAGNVTLQILSHTPWEPSPAQSRAANDQLAGAIAQHPTRLRGFATLPMHDPAAAATELARCVRELGFVGALIDTHLNGQFYDDERFWPVFEKAQELDVAVYMHPTFAGEGMMEHYRGNYPEATALALSQFGWGWHAETGLHILRLFASGLFDRFPHLKLIIGHMGELLPFQLDRCIKSSARWGGARARDLGTVWRENIYVTTSGMFTLPPLACLLQTTSVEHVLYSVDYPFSTTEMGMRFVEEVRASGLLDERGMELWAHGNAERLLKLDLGLKNDREGEGTGV